MQIKPLLSVFIFMALLCSNAISQTSIIDKINSEKLKTLPLDQHLFVHVNRTLFNELDTLWFKGYAVQGPFQQASDVSQSMVIALVDKDSIIVQEQQFLLYEGTAEGQIILPKYLKAGYYQLVAYTSNMLNFDANDFYRTNIEVRNNKQEDYNFSFAFDKSSYKPKDTVQIKLRAYGQNGLAHDYLPLKYNLADASINQKKTKFKTDEDGFATLRFTYDGFDHADTPIKVKITGNDEQDRLIEDEVYIPTASQALDVQLLPEGGQLVSGLLQTIAFRSVDDLGRPVNISGSIQNNKGETFSSFNTAHQGMGKFLLVPEVNETYTLNIEEPKQYKSTVSFPAVLNKGYALSYMGTIKNNCFFKLSKNFDGEEQISAIWQMEGIVVDAQTFVLTNQHNFSFGVQSLPTGIAKLTLFDANSEPFAERLVFIDGDRKVNIKMDLQRKEYLPRDKVTVDLQVSVKDSIPVGCDLSLTVTNVAEGINPLLPLPDIRNYTLLKTELSGNVYQPAQYFNDSTDAKELAYHRDLLMLTHGWRKFDWYYQLNQKLKQDYSFFNYDTYRGQVTKGKNILPNAQIDVFTFSKRIESFDFKSNELGRFSLNPEFEGKVSPTIMIYANKKNKLSRAVLTMEDKELEMRDSVLTLFNKELAPFIYQQNRSFYQNKSEKDSLFRFWDTKYIEEVTVKAQKIVAESDKSLGMFRSGSVHKLTQADLEGASYSMEEMIYQLNQGLTVSDDILCKYIGSDMLPIHIVYNDIVRDAEFSHIDNLNSDMIECVAFVGGTTASMVYGSFAQNGILMVWTKGGANIPTNKTLNKNAYVSERYNKVRTFYSPKYETEIQRYLPIPDKRTTMYWNNSIKTDSLGKASVSFYTSDLRGDYLINIQGISQKNGPIFKETMITVK